MDSEIRAHHPGFRYFRCGECGCEWMKPSRDATSPSGDECSECGDWIMASEATTEQYDRLYSLKGRAHYISSDDDSTTTAETVSE